MQKGLLRESKTYLRNAASTYYDLVACFRSLQGGTANF